MIARVRRGLHRRAQGASAVLDALGPRIDAPLLGHAEVAVLFVCHGNVCRSAMAEGILRRLLAQAGLLGRVAVESAGTAAVDGRRPDWRARACVRRHGASIRDLRARRLAGADFDRFDLILVMDEANRRDALALARDDAGRARVRLLLDHVGGGEIPDPAEGGPNDFQRTYVAIERACVALVAELGSRPL